MKHSLLSIVTWCTLLLSTSGRLGPYLQRMNHREKAASGSSASSPQDSSTSSTTPHRITAADIQSSPRIIGGTNAAVNEFPFFCSWGGCAASLIHEDVLLTVAHCNLLTGNTVHVGAYMKDSNSHGSEVRTIQERRVHPAYDSFTNVYDVMVMKLDAKSNKIPIRLASSNPGPGDNLVAIGHGDTSYIPPVDPDEISAALGEFVVPATPSHSDILQKVTVQYFSDTQCAAYYGSSFIADVMLCAGYHDGGKDTCRGDSGGPLLKMFSGVYEQVGITAWGNGCALPQYPGIYTDVPALHSWIEEQICDMSGNPPASCGTKDSSTASVSANDQSETEDGECLLCMVWHFLEGALSCG